MHICHLTDFPVFSLGGAEQTVHRFIQMAIENGDDVSLIQFADEPVKVPKNLLKVKVITHQPFRKVGIPWMPKKPSLVSNAARITTGFYDPIGERKISDYIKEIHPDIIHFSCLNTPGYTRALKSTGVPYAISFPIYIFSCPKGGFLRHTGELCDSPPFLCNLRNLLLHSTSPDPDIIIAQSSFMKEKLVQSGYPERIIRLVPNPIHSVAFTEKEAFTNRIVYAGRLEEYKGVIEAIQAVIQFDKDIKLTICGDGNLRAEVIDYAKKNPGRIEYLGKLSYDELSRIYDRSDAAIVPSKSYESFCMSAAESMMHGLPVIGTNIGALKEIIIDGQTGFIFTPGKVQEIKSAILNLYDDFLLYRELSKNALEISRNFSFEKVKTSLWAIYNGLKDI